MHQISLRPSAVARILGAMAILLVLASIGGQFSKFVLGHDYLKGLVPLFYMDNERNVPTYFSVLLMLFAALLLAVITILNRKQRIPHVSKWAILSFGFLVMAYDEAFFVHERLIPLVRTLLGDGNLGVFFFAWVIPGIILVLVLGLFFLRFLLDLPARTRMQFLIAAAFYIGGAIGGELFSGYYTDVYGAGNLTYSMIVALEESLELVGLIGFIWALLNYCVENYEEVRFRFEA